MGENEGSSSIKQKEREWCVSTLSLLTSYFSLDYAVKLLPHPHPPVALGLLNVKPEPCMELT